MNIIFEKMRELIPYKTCVKARANGNILIVSNFKHDIIYLNETSKDFYDLCDGSKNIYQIYLEMLNIYHVSPEEFENDIIGLIRDMQWNDLIGLKGAYTNERI